MSWKRFGLVFTAGLLACACSQPLLAQESSPYESATFTFSSDPTKVVLYVRHAGGLAATHRSMTLHGDGRLVLKNGTGRQITEEYTQQLEFQEVRRILRLAVDHGLAEWDGTRLRARMYDLNDGKAFTTPTDDMRALILLSIDDYQRGEYRLDHVERRVELYAAEYMDKNYPPISEIRGVVELTKLLKQRLKSAAKPQEP